MLRHPNYTRARLAQVTQRMWQKVYAETKPVDDLCVSPVTDRIPWADAQKLSYSPVELGEQFGPLWSTYWFQARARVPEAWSGRRVDLLWISHSEATLWVKGRTIQGLNYEPHVVDHGVRPDAQLVASAKGGEWLEFQIEMACNRLFGDPYTERPAPYKNLSPYVLDRCDLAVFDPDAWALYFDFQVLQSLETHLGQDHEKAWGGELLHELNEVANIYDADDRATWAAARAKLAPLLKRRNADRVHELSAIGHSHIDTAWLWPLAETYRKCERTFSSQIVYMDRYPAYKFACSQAQQYEWIKERNPELWGRIREKVKTGQFIPVGGSWVEPDCNVPSGESIVRQFLYGQRFFEKELGRRCNEFWQPDVFGYNGQLPQLMRLAGMRRFLTQKLSWNKFTKPQHHSFLWEGIDGSQVLAHFPPADTYNSMADIPTLRANCRNHKDDDHTHESIMLFGYGDGGGGPTATMIETLARAGDLQGLPRTALRTSDEFFTRLEKDLRDPAVQIGELYFEFHRGTYTTQTVVKAGNRASEQLLHDVELLAACASRLGAAPYPHAEIDRLWKIVLTHQFHDILPGTSVGEVYADARKAYADVRASAERLVDEALAALGGKGDRPLIPVNTLGTPRKEVARRPDGSSVFVEAPACGFGVEAKAIDSVRASKDGDRILLENGALRVILSKGGTLQSLVHKETGREALEGPGNVLELYDDKPIEWDAWDVDPFHLETRCPAPAAESATLAEQGPLLASVVFERKVGKSSRLRQTVSLAAHSGRVEFDTEVDWQESRRMLKVAFPVGVRAMNATYEMQFGTVERPTHYNTPYDQARYEVPGHRFADVSEYGFGVALLSENKFGYSTFKSTMRLSLLRSPEWPEIGTDRGAQRFRYAIFPHRGGWQEGGVVSESHRFGNPLRFCRGAAPRGFAAISDPNLVLDTIKKAEDSEAIVVRLYETHGARGVARLKVDLPFERATFANILEDDEGPVTRTGGELEIPYRPYQIITVKLA